MHHSILKTVAQAKRLIVTVVGFTILAAGIAMIVLPGPAFIVIPLGLALLATEYVWAKKLLTAVKERIEKMRK
jgi:tellurite resistance protein TerC